jgi:NADPH-dependent 2,4-dienoyl-CoA reductase/sulfur reductase-like enzyme
MLDAREYHVRCNWEGWMMKSADVVVVGGSAAGIPAAITARRHYPDKSILLVRKEERVLIPCGIPYIFGTVGTCDKNLIPDGVLEKNNIELLIDEVTDIDREKRSLTTEGGEEIGYDRLVLATGSLPIVPPIPGSEKKNVFVVNKSVPYLEGLLNVLNRASDVVVVGGGFIGIEFAEECHKHRNVNVTVVELLNHCLMLGYDEDICTVVDGVVRGSGIKLLTGEKVEEILGNDKVEKVKLASGKELKADMVIMAIGAAANSKLARKAGLELGATGGVQVDRAMRTSDENILACGDCAEKVSFFTGKPTKIKLASVATAEARVAGANLFGIRRRNCGAIGVYSMMLGDGAFASAGLTQREARENGYDIVVGHAESVNRHPGCMPGARLVKVKLVFQEATGVIIGGQVIGGESAGEFINVISACIQRKMTAEDIAVFQMGTHPALTASPIAYQLVNAAEAAAGKMLVRDYSLVV